MSYEIKKEICVRKAVLLHTDVYTFDKSFRRDIKMMTNFHVVFKRQMELLHKRVYFEHFRRFGRKLLLNRLVRLSIVMVEHYHM